MGNFLSIPILAVAAALQASLVPQIRLLGGGPELVFLLILAWSINTNVEDGIVWAFVGGIMQDLLSAAPTGTTVLGMLFIVFAVSGLGQRVYRIGFILRVGLVLFGTLTHLLVANIVLALVGFNIDWGLVLAYVIAPTIIYNLVLIWPVSWFVTSVQRRVLQDVEYSARSVVR